MFMFRMFGRTFVALALPAAALVATPVMAESDIVVSYSQDGQSTTQAKQVDISDLQLSSVKGRQIAERRILAAVKTVCSEDRIFTADGRQDYKRCFDQSRSKALADAGLTRTASR